MIFYLLIMLSNDLFISRTGIYSIPDQKSVLLLPENVCIFDRDEQTFRLYDKDGKFVKKFGKKGQGPGETEFASYVMVSDAMIFVKDQKKFNIFTSNGSFHGTAHIPETVKGYLQRSMHGWVESPSPFTLESFLWDDSFSVREVLSKQVLKSDDHENPGSKRQKALSKITSAPSLGDFDPSRLVLFPRLSPEGRFAYQPHPIRFEIKIYDLEKGKEIHSIAKPYKAIPFHRDWAESTLKQLKSELKKSGITPNIKVGYPEYMPAIRWSIITPEGFLAVRLWGKSPWIDNGSLYVFGPDGKEHTSICNDAQSLEQVVGFFGDDLIVLAYPNDEVALGKVKPEELNAFIKKYPVKVTKR